MSALLLLWPGYWPWLLLLLPALALLVVLRRRARAAAPFLFGRRERALLGERRWVRTRTALELLGICLLVFALLRPAWPGPDDRPVADVVVCIDASASMAARDGSPARLDQVRREVAALVDAGLPLRVGVLVYAGVAERRCPCTGDLIAVAGIVDGLVAGAEVRGGTDPGAALRLALAMLPRGGEVIVCSDGEDFVGEAELAAAELAAAGVAVHTVGCGEPGGSKIPQPTATGETFRRGPDGEEIVSQRDTQALERWARAGGGRALLAASGTAEPVLPTLLRDTVVPAAVTRAVRSGARVAVPAQALPLFLCLCCWMLARVLPERRR